jgi:hypothetical protein
MPATKLLWVIIVAVVALAISFLIVASLYQSANATSEDIFDNVINSGMCGLNFVNNQCTKDSLGRIVSTDQYGTNCLTKNGKPNLDCTLCETEIDGNTVYRCDLAVCGCGFGLKQPPVTVHLNKRIYKNGETLTATGVITTNLIQDKSKLEIKLSFLNSNRNNFGEIYTISTGNSDGKYEWNHELQNFPEGKYFLLVEYGTERNFREFEVTG